LSSARSKKLKPHPLFLKLAIDNHVFIQIKAKKTASQDLNRNDNANNKPALTKNSNNGWRCNNDN